MSRVVRVAILRPDAKVIDVVTVPTDLSNLQSIVGGWIESVRPPHQTHLSMFVNEEGIGLNLRPNGLASSFAGQRILGTAIVCVHDGEGEMVDLSDADLVYVKHHCDPFDDGTEEPKVVA